MNKIKRVRYQYAIINFHTGVHRTFAKVNGSVFANIAEHNVMSAAQAAGAEWTPVRRNTIGTYGPWETLGQ